MNSPCPAPHRTIAPPAFPHPFVHRKNHLSPSFATLTGNRQKSKKSNRLTPACPEFAEGLLIDDQLFLQSSSLFHCFYKRSNKISPLTPSLPRNPRKKTNALPLFLHSSSLFHTFRTRSNKISPFFSMTSALFRTLKQISLLFSDSSQKHPGDTPLLSRSSQNRGTINPLPRYRHSSNGCGPYRVQALLGACQGIRARQEIGTPAALTPSSHSFFTLALCLCDSVVSPSFLSPLAFPPSVAAAPPRCHTFLSLASQHWGFYGIA